MQNHILKTTVMADDQFAMPRFEVIKIGSALKNNRPNW